MTLLTQSPLFIVIILLLALVVGSFLGMLIYRLPRMLEQHDNEFNLAFPRSHCTHCKKSLKYWHNIPIFSYLILRGRCGFCHHPISRHYFLTELTYLIISLFLIFYFGITLKLAAALFFTALLIPLIVIDFKYQLLPDQLTFVLLWVGLFFNLFNTFAPLSEAVIGAIVGYVSLWAFTHGYYFITKRWGMGHGDFKLFAALGAWFGWLMLPYIIFIAACLGLIFALIRFVVKRNSWQTPLAFGPYLAIAGYLVLLVLK